MLAVMFVASLGQHFGSAAAPGVRVALAVAQLTSVVFTAFKLGRLNRRLAPYSLEVSPGDWQNADDGYEFIIPPRRHRKGTRPAVTVEIKKGDTYAIAGAAVNFQPDGTVVVGVGQRYAVRVTIRE